jgi:hypothetical protein
MGDDFKPIPISLFNENKLIAKTIATLDTKKKNLNFTIPKQSFHGYFSIVDTSLSYDNTLYFSKKQRKPIL